MRYLTRLPCWVVPALVLAACAGPGSVRDAAPERPVDLSEIPEPVPRPVTPSQYGNPDHYTVFGVTYHTLDAAAGYVARGTASWYGRKFHGRRTSSGEPFDMYKYSAAHRTLPLPTYARVTNLENQRSVIVRVNDRGPFKKDRLIDLSYVAALKLGFVDEGTARVEVRVLSAKSPAEPVESTRPEHTPPSIYLQAGAFAEESNAKRLQARLRQAGFEGVHVERARVERRRFYRVRIGPLASVAIADRYADRVAALGLEPPAVVID